MASWDSVPCCFDIFTSNGHVKTWEPIQRPMEEWSNGNLIYYVDVSGNDEYRLLLSRDGKAYLNTSAAHLAEKYDRKCTLVSDPKKFVKQIATGTDIWALLYIDGSVYVSGRPFSEETNKCVMISRPGTAKRISATKDTVLVNTGNKLVIYKSRTTVSCINLGMRRVRCVAAYEPGYLVLLDDGVLYCTFELKDLTVQVASPISDLYVVTGFLGANIVHMETSLDEIVCVYSDGTISYGWTDQEHECLYPVIVSLPKFVPESGSCLTHVHISRDLIWFLTSSNQVHYISKLPWLDPDNGRISRFKKIGLHDVCHFRATWNEMYFFYEGWEHQKLETAYLVDDMNKDRKIITMMKRGHPLVVDPNGVDKYGLLAGDVIMIGSNRTKIIGASRSSLLGFNEDRFRQIVEIPMTENLWNARLVDRVDGSLKTVKISDDFQLEIDCSDLALARICSFKRGDIIESVIGTARVLGERGNCLCVSIDGEICICKYSSRNAIHNFWKFRERKDCAVVSVNGITGNTIIAEQKNQRGLEAGCLVYDKVYGIGVFTGFTGDDYTVNFVHDGIYHRTVSNRPQIIRSFAKTFVNIGLKVVDVSIHEDFPICPGDVVLIDGTICFYQGMMSIDDGHICPSFHTESTIVHGFDIQKYNGERNYKVLAEYGKSSRKRQSKYDVNVSSFSDHRVLPLDVVAVGSNMGTIIGLKDSNVYIKYFTGAVEVFDEECEFELIYRRMMIPTQKTFKLSDGSDVSGWIDLKSCTLQGCKPYDLVDFQGKRFIVMAVCMDFSFIVADYDTLEYEKFEIPPGKRISRSQSLLSVDFDDIFDS